MPSLATSTPDYARHLEHVGSHWSLDAIWTTAWEDVSRFELLPGCPLKDDKWVLPSQWSGPAYRAGYMRALDFTKAVPEGWGRAEDRTEMHLRRLKRLAVLLFTQTLRISDQVRKPPQPGTWLNKMKRLLRVAREAVVLAPESASTATGCPDLGTTFLHLSVKQVRELEVTNRFFFQMDAARLNAMLRHRYFGDWPAVDVASSHESRTKETWQPFSDEFTALIGQAAIWVTEALGPDILRLWAPIKEIRESRMKSSHPRKARASMKAVIDEFLSSKSKDDRDFRFHFRVRTSEFGGNNGRTLTDWGDIEPISVGRLAELLQSAHAIIICLSCGMRQGELVSLPRECLQQSEGGNLLRGYTYKLAEASEERHWPLPGIAVKAIHQQQRLATLLDPQGQFLFASFTRSSNRPSEREMLKFDPKTFCRLVFTKDGQPLSYFCEGSIHTHRFRKTVARLAALSLVGANQTLFDILGHRDPEMTLNYILADPDLQGEMRKIAREAVLLMAKEAVNDADNNGGPASDAVRELKQRFKARSAEAEMDETSLMSVAKILSQDGRVILAKKNVLCTKALNQAGPCNKKIGNPDVGNCQIDCLHRLELAAAKHDHHHALLQALESYDQSEGMMRVWWQGQVITHLLPFEDLAKEMMNDERVAALVAEIRDSPIEGVELESYAGSARILGLLT
jgi:integrase